MDVSRMTRPASVSPAAISAAESSGEVWKCTQRLNTPSGYQGGLLRLELEQKVGDQSVSSIIVDGETLTFPYQLDLSGIPGVPAGYLHLSELVGSDYTQLGTYTLEFKQVEE